MAAQDVVPQIIVRIVKAELTKNFEFGGKMDPYATVEIVKADGSKVEVGQTRTDWNAHMNPVWNHTCPGQPDVAGEKVRFAVFEDDVVGTDDLIGDVIVPVQELLGTPNEKGESTGNLHGLKITNKKQEVGSVFVQVLLVNAPLGQTQIGQKALTKVDASLFDSPVVRLGVSGGTAPFFKMKMLKPGPKEGNSPGFYVGKDLSHASDEIDFYEQLGAVIGGAGGSAFAPLLSFCFEYLGVATCAIADAKPDSKPKDLIVMRNLFDGANSLRLLDIKIGQKTAAAGWQGKSRMAALKQSVVDGITNSAAEGYRLEGFDGLPPVLKSMDPLVGADTKLRKKAFRYLLQTRSGAEVLAHFYDVHQSPEDPGEAKQSSIYTPTEFTEIVNSEICRRLARLAIACRLAPAPQKWIGSSVALAFDAGQTPARSTSEANIRKGVKVHIFDWGRSELNSLEKNNSFSVKERQDRAEFWGYYTGGIDRLAYEAARLHYNRFCNADEWGELWCYVFDFDANSKDDFLGKAKIPLQTTAETTVTLLSNTDKEVTSGLTSGSKSTLTFSVAWRSYPSGYRLKGAWRVKLVKAQNLPSCDKMKGGSSDPYASLVAASKDENRYFRQQTSVKPKCINPVWEEYLEVPVAARDDLLEAMLKSVSPELVKQPLAKIMVPESGALPRSGTSSRSSSMRLVDEEKCITGWEECLDEAAANTQTLEPFFSSRPDDDPSPQSAKPVDVAELRAMSNRSIEDMKATRCQLRKEGGENNVKPLQVEARVLPVEGPPTGSSPQEKEEENFSKLQPTDLESPEIEAAKAPGQCSDKCQLCKCM